MRVALILPPMSLEERYGKAIAKVAGTLPPLGLVSLGTVLKQAGHTPMILDGSRIDYQTILSALSREDPRVIGISTMTFVWPKAKRMLAQFRAAFPKAYLVIGGAHATMHGRGCLEESGELDGLVCGEGERTVLQLVDCLERNGDKKAIPGLIFRENGTIHENPPRAVIADLDTLPIPDRGLVPTRDYVPAFSQYRTRPVTNMFTTRGCPYKCLFCFPEVLGRTVRFRSPESVMREIRYLQTEHGIKEVAFWDDTFTISRDRVMRIAQLLRENRPRLVWSAQARVDKVDPEMLAAMAEAGCWKLHCGLESMVQKNLDVLQKGTTVEQNVQAVRMIKDAGIEVEASFIFGTPGETFQDGHKTIEIARKLDIDYARFFSFTPYGNFRDAVAGQGTFLTDDLGLYSSHNVVFVPHSMTSAQLHELIRLAYTRFYFRPRYLLKRLWRCTNWRTILSSVRGVRAMLMIASGKTSG